MQMMHTNEAQGIGLLFIPSENWRIRSMNGLEHFTLWEGGAFPAAYQKDLAIFLVVLHSK